MRHKGCPKGFKGSGPNSNVRVYVVVVVSDTTKQLSDPGGCPAIQLNSDTIYEKRASVSTD